MNKINNDISNQEKIVMDDYLNYIFRSYGNVKVSTRSGNITSVADLSMISADKSSNIIILPFF